MVTDHCSLITPSLALAFLLLARLGHAQDIEPRRWSHLPTGANFGAAAYAYTTGDILFDPALRIQDAKFDLQTIADLVTVPIESDFEFSSDSRHALAYPLNVQPVVPFPLTKDWLLVTRTIIPLISQEAVVAGERDKTGLGDINQSFFFSPARLVGGWTVGAGPVFQYPSATSSELGSGKWGVGPTFAMLRQKGGWSFGVLANQIWSFADDRHRELVNTSLVDPLLSYTWKNDFTVEFDGESTYDWVLRQWTVPLTAGASQPVTIGKQSVSFGWTGVGMPNMPPAVRSGASCSP